MANRTEWQGKVGAEWARRSDDLEPLLGPPGAAGLAALGPVAGLRVLDLGCGAGSSSRALHARGARVTGLDVSPDLLAAAKARGGGPDYRLADAERDDPGGPYGALFSRFGAMFFDDPVSGWRNLHGAMMPGAAAVIVAWQGMAANSWVTVPAALAQPHAATELSAASAAGAPGPFAWADPDFARDTLSRAGWRDVAIDGWRGPCGIGMGDDPDPVARAVLATLRIGPIASRLRGADEATLARIRSALTGGLATYVVDGAVLLEGAAWIIRARA